MTLIALDFDGVLCDSAAETAASAWKCARELWPDLLTTELVPCEIVEQFLQVRPWLETGWQSVLMIRMLLEKLPMTAFREELEFHYERLMRKTGLDAASLIRKFAESRDEWIRRDPESWLKSHRFYPGTITALQEALHEHDVYILTTKQQRFAQKLLEGQGIAFPPEKIRGLETGQPKECQLQEFIRQGAENIIFVEDRLETLLRVTALPQPAAVQLFYALWGYGTTAEQQQARSNPAITCLELQQFNALIAGTQSLAGQ